MGYFEQRKYTSLRNEERIGTRSRVLWRSRCTEWGVWSCEEVQDRPNDVDWNDWKTRLLDPQLVAYVDYRFRRVCSPPVVQTMRCTNRKHGFDICACLYDLEKTDKSGLFGFLVGSNYGDGRGSPASMVGAVPGARPRPCIQLHTSSRILQPSMNLSACSLAPFISATAPNLPCHLSLPLSPFRHNLASLLADWTPLRRNYRFEAPDPTRLHLRWLSLTS